MTGRCAIPGCSADAVHPHPASLCQGHHPGDPPESTPDADGDDAAGDPRLPWEFVDWLVHSQREPSEPDPADLMAAAMGDPEASAQFARSDVDERPASTPSAGRTSLPTGALPLAHLDALDTYERASSARQRGEDWPTTGQARERLFDSIAEVILHADDRVVDAPTSLGKTHTVAATRWGARDDLTGGRPVVHLLETLDARDEAIDIGRREGGSFLVLRSRHEACPVAAGDHDEDLTVDGTPASEWLEAVCEGRGVPFSAAHRHLEGHHEGDLPCQADGGCDAIDQWREFREGDHALVIATHNFAYAPGVRMENNVVVDEQPDFADERLTTDRVRRAVGAYLREIGAPVTTWEAFIQLARHDGVDGDAATERDALDNALDTEPDRDWYFEHRDPPIRWRRRWRGPSSTPTNGRTVGGPGRRPTSRHGSTRTPGGPRAGTANG